MNQTPSDRERAQALADNFCGILATTLGPADYKDLRVNHVRTTSYCPSHDYCDANMVMLSAWMKTYGSLGPLGEPAEVLMNLAWDIARDQDFVASN